MDAHVKMQRIKRENRAHLNVLADVLNPEVLHARVPRLATSHEGRLEMKAFKDEMSVFGKLCRANGFDPTRTFQHVATIDQSVWSAILEVFAKYDEESGELMDDGLLYKTDPKDNTVKLNKDFFYAIVDYLESIGVPTAMRGKIKLT